MWDLQLHRRLHLLDLHLLHRRRTKANDARSSEQRLHAISLFSQNNFFLLSLVITSVWWEWVGDRNLLGDIKIWPWKCRYRLGLKAAIVLISISKKVSPKKLKMSAIFILKKQPPKKVQIFHIFIGPLFRNGWPYYFYYYINLFLP